MISRPYTGIAGGACVEVVVVEVGVIVVVDADVVWAVVEVSEGSGVDCVDVTEVSEGMDVGCVVVVVVSGVVNVVEVEVDGSETAVVAGVDSVVTV